MNEQTSISGAHRALLAYLIRCGRRHRDALTPTACRLADALVAAGALDYDNGYYSPKETSDEQRD